MSILSRWHPGWQIRLRYVWITRLDGYTTVWVHVAGRKPLAHLPRWKRQLLHLPSLRWRLWPKPWNFNGPTAGWRKDQRHLLDHRLALWSLIHDVTQEMPTDRRVYWLEKAEEILR